MSPVRDSCTPVQRRRVDIGDTVASGSAEKTPPSETGKKLGGKLNNMLSDGMHPDRVGEMVLDAMLNDRFWIFTHKGLLKFVQEQHDLMSTEQLLSRGKLV